MEIKLDLTPHQIQQLREIIDRHPLVDRVTGESYHVTIVTVSKALPMLCDIHPAQQSQGHWV